MVYCISEFTIYTCGVANVVPPKTWIPTSEVSMDLRVPHTWLTLILRSLRLSAPIRYIDWDTPWLYHRLEPNDRFWPGWTHPLQGSLSNIEGFWSRATKRGMGTLKESKLTKCIREKQMMINTKIVKKIKMNTEFTIKTYVPFNQSGFVYFIF